jgi:tryptophan synthase alpha chain
MSNNRLTKILSENKKLLSIYVTAGFPLIDDTEKIVLNLEQNKVDFIELGMPFSDPMADGPVIQETSEIALKNGMTIPKYFQLAKEIRGKSNIPLVFMGYYNQILKFGKEKFYKNCKDSGIDSLIIPDLPIEEYKTDHKDLLDKYEITISFLITPTTSEQRIKEIDAATSGFIYVVSSNSITGKQEEVNREQTAYFSRLESMNLKSKLIVGFGIHDRKSYQNAIENCDGAIIGSAFLKSLYSGKTSKDIQQFISSIR